MSKPMSLKEFKNIKINSLSKNRVHPKSPYDPTTMKTYSPKYNTGSSPSHHHPKSLVKRTIATSTPFTKKPTKCKKKFDINSFLGSDEEDDNEDSDEENLTNNDQTMKLPMMITNDESPFRTSSSLCTPNLDCQKQGNHREAAATNNGIYIFCLFIKKFISNFRNFALST